MQTSLQKREVNRLSGKLIKIYLGQFQVVHVYLNFYFLTLKFVMTSIFYIQIAISHVLNEQGTGYECLKSIGVKCESYLI